jgi:hypothetical protein
MTTSIKSAVPSKQVLREPSRELNADELELVMGGTPSANPKGAKPEKYMTYDSQTATVSGY